MLKNVLAVSVCLIFCAPMCFGDTIKLHGRVVLEDGETPAAGLTVQVEHHENRKADEPDDFVIKQLTGEDGGFSFELSEDEKQYMLFVADEKGHVFIGYPHLSKSRNFGAVVLKRGCVLTGKLVDAKGSKLPDVELKLELKLEASCSHYVDVSKENTGENGEFEFDDLSPGTYRCRVLSEQHTPGINTVEVTDEFSYLELKVDKAARFEGRVLDTNGNPVSGLRIKVGSIPSAKTDDQGTFAIGGLASEEYRVTIASKAYGLPENKAVKIRTKTGKTLKRDIRVVATGSLALTLKPKEEDIAIPERVRVSLTIPNNWQAGHRYLDGKVRDGVVRLDGLSPGSYKMEVQNDEIRPCYAKVTIESGKETSMTFTLEECFTISGAILKANGIPAEGLKANCSGPKRVSDSSRHIYKQENVGADGSFRFGGLAPGKYTISFYDSGYSHKIHSSTDVSAGTDDLIITLGAKDTILLRFPALRQD